MKKQSVTERRFKCEVCGTVMTAYKRTSRQTKTDHTKHLWCYKCKKRVAFKQLDRWS